MILNIKKKIKINLLIEKYYPNISSDFNDGLYDLSSCIYTKCQVRETNTNYKLSKTLKNHTPTNSIRMTVLYGH